MKLITSNEFKAALVNDNINELCVCLEGPKDTPYEGGLWKVHVELPDQYPYKSPSIGFETKIFHPNIDEQSGSVCLDVINQTWSPMFTISHIFETFLPQLLNYPNAADPLNGDASTLYLNDKFQYDSKVKTYVKKYANKSDVLRQFHEETGIDLDSESDLESDNNGIKKFEKNNINEKSTIKLEDGIDDKIQRNDITRIDIEEEEEEGDDDLSSVSMSVDYNDDMELDL